MNEQTALIMVKAPCTGWHIVSKEQAYRFARQKLLGAWCQRERVLEHINNDLLQGITFTEEELLYGMRN